jgi:hypothetical protein
MMLRTLSRIAANAVASFLPKGMMLAEDNFEVWQRRGYHVTPNHFYGPIPDTRVLGDAVWDWRSRSFAFDFRAGQQGELLKRLEGTPDV